MAAVQKLFGRRSVVDRGPGVGKDVPWSPAPDGEREGSGSVGVRNDTAALTADKAVSSR